MEQAKKKLFLPQSSENIWVGLVLFHPFKFLGKNCRDVICTCNFPGEDVVIVALISCIYRILQLVWLFEIILIFVAFKEFVHFIYVVEYISIKVYNISHPFKGIF